MFGATFNPSEALQKKSAAEDDQARFDSLTEASQVGIWFCDLPFDSLVWDAQVKDHFWLPPDAEVTIDTFYDRLHPADRERTRLAIEESIFRKRRYSIEYRTVSPEGNIKWIHAIGHPHYNGNGEPIRFDGITIDISEHKLAEESIRQRTAQFETLLNAAPMGVYLVDADFKIRQVNPVALPVFGGIPNLIGSDFAEVLHRLWEKDFADELIHIFKHVLESGEPYASSEHIRPRRDRGVVECYEWQINRIPLPDGRSGVVCYFRDISQRVLADRQLRESQEERERQRRLYETILSNTPDLTYVFDLNHRFTYANDVLLRMWGKSWDEAIGKNCLELGYEPWHAAMHDREIEQVIATKRPIRGEVPFSGTFGRRIYDYIFVPVFDAEGNVEAIAGTTRDVTERQQVEQRNQFLLQLDDALRPLTDPQEITLTAARLVGERLGVDRCAYADVEADEDTMNLTGNYLRTKRVRSIVGRLKFSDFGAEVLQLMRDDKPYVVHDVDHHQPALPETILSAYRQTQIQSVICVPLHKAGRFVASVAVHMATPRTWVPEEIELVKAVGARCWESIERARLERGLRESEAKFRAFVTASSDVIYRMSPDWSEMRHLEGQDFILSTDSPSSSWLDKYIHHDDQPFVLAAISEAIASKSIFELEHRIIRVDGSLGWTFSRAIPLLDENGCIIEWFGAATDVSERRQVQELLRQSRDQMRLISDSVPVLISYVDAQERYQFCNRAYTRWFNLPGEQIIGRHLSDVLGAQAWSTIKPYMQRALSGEALEFEILAEFPSGPRWIHATYAPHRNTDGHVLGVIVTVNDISEVKNQQDALRKSEERYRSLFESIDEGFCVIEVIFDEQRRPVDYWFLEINPAFENHSGLREAEGKLMTDFVSEIEPHWLENYGHVALTGEPIRFAGEYKSLGRWFDVYAFRVGDSNSRRVAVLFTNITQRMETEQALRESEERARSASVAKDNFLAQLSHELRTPLTPVLMTAAAMRDDETLTGPARDAFGMIERNIALEARLIDDLLDLTRVTRGKLTLREEVCDVHSLFHQAVDIVRDEIQEKRIRLTVDLAAKHTHLRGDPARLQQVFWNLLRNAVNFTPQNGEIRIRSCDTTSASFGPCDTKTLGTEPGICLEVTDSGIGFAADLAESLFEPFYQGKGSGSSGLGLGLAIARAIVDLHHGAIFGRSQGVGQGATFSVRLPISTDLSTKATGIDANFNALSEASSPGHVERHLRLLVVEDHEATLKVLTSLLTRAGHTVTSASTVAEALEIARTGSFDAMVSDLGLPDGTGIELMEAVRANGRPGFTGVALSGYGMDADIRRSRQAGFSAHLVKPVNFDELRRALRELRPRC